MAGVKKTAPEDDEKKIKFTGYYLEHRSGGSSKFYAIYVGDDGSYCTHWGRIGTSGQSAINALPRAADAMAMGEKQMYAKMSKGYQMIHNAVEFEVAESVMKVIKIGRLNPGHLYPHFKAAVEARAEQATTGVLTAYDGFLGEIQRALDLLTSTKGQFENFQELDELWTKIQDKHAEAETIMSLARMSAVSNLVGA